MKKQKNVEVRVIPDIVVAFRTIAKDLKTRRNELKIIGRI